MMFLLEFSTGFLVFRFFENLMVFSYFLITFKLGQFRLYVESSDLPSDALVTIQNFEIVIILAHC